MPDRDTLPGWSRGLSVHEFVTNNKQKAQWAFQGRRVQRCHSVASRAAKSRKSDARGVGRLENPPARGSRLFSRLVGSGRRVLTPTPSTSAGAATWSRAEEPLPFMGRWLVESHVQPHTVRDGRRRERLTV